MKNFYLKGLGLILMLGGMLFMPVQAFSQLSGTYTIDPNSSSSNNYTSFANAVSALASSGVNGAVVFEVADGDYNEQISISSVSGASSSNTITFESASGDSSAVRLYYASSSSGGSDHTLELNGANYVTFRQITIQRTGNADYAAVVRLNNSASNNSFIGCLIIGRKEPSNTTFAFNQDHNALVTSTGACSNNLYLGNRLIYGYNGFYVTGTASGNRFMRNEIDTCGASAIYIINQSSGLVIERNIFRMGTFGTGVSQYVCYGIRMEGSASFSITKNRIWITSDAQVTRGIVLFSNASTSSDPGIIANNFILVTGGSTSASGFATAGCQYLDFYYNSVLVTAPLSVGTALYVYPPAQAAGNNNNFVNNNLINKGGGMAMDISGNTSGVGTCDYNNLYSNGSVFGNWNGTNYSNLSGWQSGSSKDANSISGDPGFISDFDLHVTSAFLDGKATPHPTISDDIDGDTRNSSTPDIGADEFTPAALDIGVTRIDSPRFFCAGTHDVWISISNFGTSTITSATIEWSVDGTSKSSYSWSGSLASGATSASFSIGTHTFSSNVLHKMKIWTTAPNGSTDGLHLNDTLNQVKATGMSGSFTIGGSSPDFGTFNEAVLALTARGLCGAVVLKARDGVYSEQLNFPEFRNATATFDVTFTSESGDSSKVILEHLAVTGVVGVNNSVIQFNGGDFITFDKITIRRTGTGTYASVIETKSGSHNLTFKHCQLIGTPISGATTTGDVFFYLDNGTDSNLTFHNNRIVRGHYGLNLLGTGGGQKRNITITDNWFDSTFTTQARLQYGQNVKINGNLFTNINSSQNAVDLQNCGGTLEIKKNRIILESSGTNALSLTNCTPPSSTPGLIANNFIACGSGSATNGIILSACQDLNIYHNSVNMSLNKTSAAAFNCGSNGSDINLLNNIFRANNGLAMSVANGGVISSSDHNNLFTGGNVLVSWGGNNYSSLSAYTSGVSQDANSVSMNPSFQSPTEPLVNNLSLANKGKATALVTDDIYGNPRTAKPTPGAHEARPPANDAGLVGIYSPVNTVCEATLDVNVYLINNGSDTLRSVDIEWIVDGTQQTTYSWSGTLAPDSVAGVTLGNHTFSARPNNYDIKAWTVDPNGVADVFPNNDTNWRSTRAYAQPKAIVGNDTTVCGGAQLTFGGPSTTSHFYEWSSRPAGFSAFTSTINVKPTASITYILKETGLGFCQVIDSVVVTVEEMPSSAVAPSQSICVGTSVDIGGPATPGYSYAWRDITNGVDISTSPNPTVAPQNTTTYVLTTTSTAGCEKRDTVRLTVNPRPAAVVGVSRTVCEGQISTLGTAATPGNTYSWTSNPAGFVANTSSVTVQPNATTTYYLKETITATGCEKIDSARITVLPRPTATIAGSASACVGATTTYEATTVAGDAYAWTVDGGSIVSGGGTSQIAINWSNQGTHRVRLTQTRNGCTDTTSYPVSIKSAPVVKQWLNANFACVNTGLQFRDSSTNAASRLWTFGDGGTSTDASPGYAYTEPGSYQVKLKVFSADGCADSSVSTVQIHPVPVANFVAPTTCEGSAMTLNNTSTGGTTYLWRFGGGVTSTDANPTHLFGPAGTYEVTLVAYNPGCENSVTKTVTIQPNPGNGWTVVKTTGRTYRFTAHDSSHTNYVWVFGDNTPNGSGHTVTHTYAANGSYNISMRIRSASNCTTVRDSTFSVTVSVDETQPLAESVQVFPNPFTNNATVVFELQRTQMVKVSVHDMTGRQVADVTQGMLHAGRHQWNINGAVLSPGMYMLRIQVGDSFINKPMIRVE